MTTKPQVLERLARTLVAHRQVLAALLAAALQNLPAVLGFHALAKAVLVLPLAAAGLVGALRHNK